MDRNDCKAPVATSTLGSKKPSNISRTKNVALKLPKISITKGYFGQFKGYIFAVLGHFCFLLRLGGCLSQGLCNLRLSKVWTNGPDSSSKVSPETGIPFMALPRLVLDQKRLLMMTPRSVLGLASSTVSSRDISILQQ